MILKRGSRLYFLIGLLPVMIGVLAMAPLSVYAAKTPSDFSLLVTPSPIVATLKPGESRDLELKIRNGSTGTEALKIVPRRFTINDKTGQVLIDDKTAPDIAQWIRFSKPTFTVESGEWMTEKIHIALPKNTGFSYSFVLLIQRAQDTTVIESGRLIKGSVAVFTLINVDRPGAVRSLTVEKFVASQSMYEYLPASLTMQFRNNGNTIIQPFGNIFIQRGSNDASPIATLPVNNQAGYILPGSNRVLTAQWSGGFPLFKATTASDGSQKTSEEWDWSKLSQFRIGAYTAKLVAVYNDGLRDVAIQKETSFWVLPWKILLGAVAVIAILLLGVWSIIRRIFKLFRRPKRSEQKPEE
ncbi:MAG: hypothetical protein H6797_00980 [Candidatus Nomurabacteria bacterium]|nr:MAG: hypothetical protein H6797_00980 [Candidatus Nomurabacteria bacterium]